jgi:hypothetical protein
LAALDRVREEVAYLKVWQGIAVVGGITLAGWLLSAPESASPLTYGLAVAGVSLLTLVSLILHRQIHSRIALMERL